MQFCNPDRAEGKRLIKEHDDWMKEHCRDLYDAFPDLSIRLLRMSNFALFTPACLLYEALYLR